MSSENCNRVDVHIWERGTYRYVNPLLVGSGHEVDEFSSIGHVAIETFFGDSKGTKGDRELNERIGIYASFWPRESVRKGKLSSIETYEGKHNNYKDDCESEKRKPDKTITLYTLDVSAINEVYYTFQDSNCKWSVLGSFEFTNNEKAKNCAALVYKLLEKGGMFLRMGYKDLRDYNKPGYFFVGTFTAGATLAVCTAVGAAIGLGASLETGPGAIAGMAIGATLGAAVGATIIYFVYTTTISPTDILSLVQRLEQAERQTFLQVIPANIETVQQKVKWEISRLNGIGLFKSWNAKNKAKNLQDALNRITPLSTIEHISIEDFLTRRVDSNPGIQEVLNEKRTIISVPTGLNDVKGASGKGIKLSLIECQRIIFIINSINNLDDTNIKSLLQNGFKYQEKFTNEIGLHLQSIRECISKCLIELGYLNNHSKMDEMRIVNIIKVLFDLNITEIKQRSIYSCNFKISHLEICIIDYLINNNIKSLQNCWLATDDQIKADELKQSSPSAPKEQLAHKSRFFPPSPKESNAPSSNPINQRENIFEKADRLIQKYEEIFGKKSSS